jgi:acyl-[acyl-carrier-protein] desaturase
VPQDQHSAHSERRGRLVPLRTPAASSGITEAPGGAEGLDPSGLSGRQGLATVISSASLPAGEPPRNPLRAASRTSNTPLSLGFGVALLRYARSMSDLPEATDLDGMLLIELTPEAERLLTRHLGVAQEWFPHEYIPYRLGRDFDGDPWTPDQPRLTGVAQTAFEINLLTEDNLPSYHRLIHRLFGKGDGAWMTWVGRWTAEEGRHAIVLRDYLTVTRNIDPVLIERGRMAQVQHGYDHDAPGVLRGLAYVAFQELATRISHRNTGRYSDDPVADKIMVRIAADENLHMVFYRDIVAAALSVRPSEAVRAIVDEVLDFKMPGTAIPGFRRKAAEMAKAGIYDLRVHRDEVLLPLLGYWRIFDLTGLDAAAEEARRNLAVHLERLDLAAKRFSERLLEPRVPEAASSR